YVPNYVFFMFEFVDSVPQLSYVIFLYAVDDIAPYHSIVDVIVSRVSVQSFDDAYLMKISLSYQDKPFLDN
ncbi:hypothetical protein, partial [Staphylococcus aureus]